MTTGGILSSASIRQAIEAGQITIDPYNPVRVNPTSVDLTLGTGVKLYRDTYVGDLVSDAGSRDGSDFKPRPKAMLHVMDSKVAWPTDDYQIDPEVGWVLLPGIFYLMHTAERVTTNHYVPIIDGKSSVGRASIVVHKTAGYGDPGFDGQYTLEVSTDFPVRVYPGMRFCQIRFHSIVGVPDLYQEKGHYKGDNARGAISSQLYKQFDS